VAIVLGISAGSLIAGIPGAVLAVPILATVKAGASRLAELSTEGTPSSSPSNSGAA
jgi:predicted PurR-regulated permease PerM